jgi:ubiquinone/menaquinone biosynthesis C-methylase UbiE
MVTHEQFTQVYAGGAPPWDIGRPQRDLVAAFDEIRIAGSALDLGCGTGDNALELARRGLDVWGIDMVLPAIEAARAKAAERGLSATFVHGDALDLGALGRRFDTVIDCGLFHVISEEDRRRHVAELSRVLEPGGRFLMLGFATSGVPVGPRGYSPDELRAYLTGFREIFVRPAAFEARPGLPLVDAAIGGVPAWVSLFERA